MANADFCSCKQIIKQLLLQEDEKGKTPLDEALRRHTAECEELLRELIHATANV